MEIHYFVIAHTSLWMNGDCAVECYDFEYCPCATYNLMDILISYSEGSMRSSFKHSDMSISIYVCVYDIILPLTECCSLNTVMFCKPHSCMLILLWYNILFYSIL